MSLIKSSGIVLRDYDLSEQDKIVVFYTLKFGLIRVVAKGARKIKSRFAPAIQFPSYTDLLIYRGRNSSLGTLSDCRIRCSFSRIREDILRYAYASYLAEIFLSFLEEGGAASSLFYMLVKALSLLEKGERENFKILISAFGLKFLHELGYSPELRKCIHCQRERDSFHSVYFSPEDGGILCERCHGSGNGVIGVPRLTILAMDYLLHARISSSPNPDIRRVERQIGSLLEIYFSYHLDGQRSKSLNFIRELEELFKAAD